jgi:hypothetical protein
MRNLLIPLFLFVVSSMAVAHEGHGFSGAHWHASDLFGPLMLAAGAAAVWWARKK